MRTGRHPFVLVDTGLAGRSVGDRVALASDQRHHLGNVLRLGDGDPVELADGTGARVIGSLVGGHVELTEAPRTDDVPKPVIHVLQAVPKGRKLDEVVRVLTELDVDRLTLVAAQHSIGRMDAERAAKLIVRLDAVSVAAAQQSRRSRRLAIDGPVPVERVATSPSTLLLVADPDDGDRAATGSLVGALSGSEVATVQIAIGPEGGWRADERAWMVDQGGVTVGLGPTVLRTEHAAAAAVAVVAAVCGRW